eukprot:7381416-Prymnesium_polylepis.1
MVVVWLSCLYSDLRPFYLYANQAQAQARGSASPRQYEQKLAPRPKLAYWFNLFAPLSLGVPVAALCRQLALPHCDSPLCRWLSTTAGARPGPSSSSDPSRTVFTAASFTAAIFRTAIDST